MGLSGKGGKQGKCGVRPPRPKPNWFRAKGAGPLFPSPPLPFLPPLLLGIGGVLLLVGVGLPLGAPSLAGRPLPLGSFIYGGRGHPIDTQVDLRIVP